MVVTALRSAIDTQFRQWISRLKRENLSNFFNRYINFSRWLKSFLISRYYKMQKKKKRNHRYPINRQFRAQIRPTSKSLSKHFRLSHAVFPSPLIHHRGRILHPSSCQTPFHDFTGLEGLSPRSSYRRPISIRIDPPDRERGGGRAVFAEARRPTYFRRGTLERPIGDEAFLDRAISLSRSFPSFSPFFSFLI